MKTNRHKIRHTCGVFLLMALMTLVALLHHYPSSAQVIDNNPVTDQRWIISEIYLGTDDYKGAYVELYNNDDHTSLGWKDFVINLPFDIDLPPMAMTSFTRSRMPWLNSLTIPINGVRPLTTTARSHYRTSFTMVRRLLVKPLNVATARSLLPTQTMFRLESAKSSN